MSTYSTERSDEEGANARSAASRVVSSIENRKPNGSIAILVGGGLLASAIRRRRNREGRAAALALTGLAALGIGLRRRRTGRDADDVETGADARRDEDGTKKVSDESRAETERDLGAGRNADESASVYQSEAEPNPRGVSDRSDVRTDDGGDIDFVEGKTPGAHRETHVEDESAHDPRLHPEPDDERTEIDLSEAAMADEASEAAGPHPEQAYPAREGTDPEPTSDEAPERAGEGAVAPADSESDDRRTDGATNDDDGAAEPAEGGTESEPEDETDGQ